MSAPLPLFKVKLMIGREVDMKLHARDAQAATDIATYLFLERHFEHFHESDELIIDTVVTTGEAAI
jgi:hypothetical protein